ncbi:MAG: response regulator transcription factor [Rhodospirillaceae bacterium]
MSSTNDAETDPLHRSTASFAPVYRRGPGPARTADGYDRLTGRERWIVSQLVKHRGAPNKVIAYALQISPNTLRNHLASIYAKLGVRRRVELVLYAMERGIDGLADE